MYNFLCRIKKVFVRIHFSKITLGYFGKIYNYRKKSSLDDNLIQILLYQWNKANDERLVKLKRQNTKEKDKNLPA